MSTVQIEIENLEADVRFHQEKIREAIYKIHKLKMSEPKDDMDDWYNGDGGEIFE